MNCDKKTINLTESALKTPVALVISLLHLLEAIKQGFISSSVVRPQRLFKFCVKRVFSLYLDLGSIPTTEYIIWTSIEKLLIIIHLSGLGISRWVRNQELDALSLMGDEGVSRKFH